MRTAVQALPEHLRLTVELRYLVGLENREIAETLSLSTRAVEKRLNTARNRLKHLLVGGAYSATLLAATPESAIPAEPPTLLPDLLRIVERGSALDPTWRPEPDAGSVSSSSATAPGLAAAMAIAMLAVGVVVLGTMAFHAMAFHGPAEAPADSGTVATVAETPEKPQSSDAPRPPSPPVEDAISGPTVLPEDPRLGGLHGIVLEEATGTALGGAVVVWRGGGDRMADLKELGFDNVAPEELRAETRADADGAYHFEGLLPVSGRLFIRKDERVNCHYQVSAGVRSGQMRRVDVPACRPRRLWGRVTDEAGAGIPGAELIITDHAVGHVDGEEGYHARIQQRREGNSNAGYLVFHTDALGHYDMGERLLFLLHLPRWKFVVRAEQFGWREVPIDLESFGAGDEFELNVTLPPAHRAALRVTTPEGEPVEHALVKVSKKHGYHLERWRRTETAADGTATLDTLGPGNYGLRVSKDGYHSAKAEWSPESALPLEFTLTPIRPAAITGRLLFDSRFPASSLEVDELYPEMLAGEAFHPVDLVSRKIESIDDHSHRFQFWPREPGTYRLVYWGDLRASSTAAFEFDGQNPVEVDFPIRLAPPYLTGVVVDSTSGDSVSDASLIATFVRPGLDSPSAARTFRSWNGFAIPSRLTELQTCTRTNAEGTFILRMPNGRNGAGEDSIASGTLFLRVESPLGYAELAPIPWNQATVIAGFEIELLPPGTIAGRVTDEVGAAAFSELIAASNGRGIVRTTQTDAQGNYRIDELQADHYFVEALGRTR